MRATQQVGDGVGLVAAQLVAEAAQLCEHAAVAGLGQARCAEASGVGTAQHQLIEGLVLEADLRCDVGAEVRVLVHAHRRILRAGRSYFHRAFEYGDARSRVVVANGKAGPQRLDGAVPGAHPEGPGHGGCVRGRGNEDFSGA
ncbi:hypothetical protein G6F50_014891 [Rhizopus delemar]|uniref:Uncharacterized protein n=1 Tax=Rhizopus delemar TaxID=936053 RepID=A0A9P6Y1M0_9FUNG|nr:hypothetical protein G6F50_014891 [Rhizopus delemar]